MSQHLEIDSTSRRRFLAASAALLLLPSFSVIARSRPSFAAASTALAGPDATDPEMAAAIAKALSQTPLADDVTRLVALAARHSGAKLGALITARGLEAAANAIVAAWHGGFVGSTLISYPGALAWKAVPFLRPGGYCGGAFGYWAEPPL